MPAAPRCSAGSRAAICGAGARPIAPRRSASSATPISSAPTARCGGRYRRRGRSRRGHRRAMASAKRASRYVVLTGGEPLLQVDAALIEALHDARLQHRRRDQRHADRRPRASTGSASARRPAPNYAALRRRIEAGVSARRRRARIVRGPGLRALLAAADGRPRRRRQYAGGDRLLPAPSAMAAQRADPQDAGDQVDRSQPMIAGEPRHGLVGDRASARRIEREIRRQPGVFGERQDVAERRPFGDAAGDEIGRLQRKLRRAASAAARSIKLAATRADRRRPPARAQASISRSR